MKSELLVYRPEGVWAMGIISYHLLVGDSESAAFLYHWNWDHDLKCPIKRKMGEWDYIPEDWEMLERAMASEMTGLVQLTHEHLASASDPGRMYMERIAAYHQILNEQIEPSLSKKRVKRATNFMQELEKA